MKYLVVFFVIILVVGCSSSKELTKIDEKYSETVSYENFDPITADRFARTKVIGDSTVVVSTGDNQ